MTRESDRINSALGIITQYGGIDGDHQKQWVLDQVVRILTDCPDEHKVSIHNGKEYPYTVLGESPEYKAWVTFYQEGEDGPETYSWDEGIAP